MWCDLLDEKFNNGLLWLESSIVVLESLEAICKEMWSEKSTDRLYTYKVSSMPIA